jgi:hypothetical protein
VGRHRHVDQVQLAERRAGQAAREEQQLLQRAARLEPSPRLPVAPAGRQRQSRRRTAPQSQNPPYPPPRLCPLPAPREGGPPSESGGRRTWVGPTWKQILAVPASPSLGSSPTRLRKAARCVSVLTWVGLGQGLGLGLGLGLRLGLGFGSLRLRAHLELRLGELHRVPHLHRVAALGESGCSSSSGLESSIAWRGVAWRGVAWRGVAWRGVAWRGAPARLPWTTGRPHRFAAPRAHSCRARAAPGPG